MAPTPTEQRLAELCRNSFLGFWSHPHPFFAPGEELCDLLAVFGDDIFLFSDKARELAPAESASPTEWHRWRRKAVQDSIDAIFKAERALKKYRTIYRDAKATVPLPVQLPEFSRARIHRIAVANGAAAACRAVYGGTGSLFVSTLPEGPDLPFAVHALNTEGGLIHVFDEASLPILLGELDTMPEFRDYLLCKEEIVALGAHITAVGEEDLLALYQQRRHHAYAERHGFGPVSARDHLLIDSPEWPAFRDSAHRQARIKANKDSYYWDNLIERFSGHAIEGTQYMASPGGPTRTEQTLRILAAEPRTPRRELGAILYSLATATPIEMRIGRLHVSPSGVAYTFLFVDQPDGIAYEEHREFRRGLLGALLFETRELFPQATAHVAVASTTVHAKSHSEDLLQLQPGAPPLNEIERAKLKDLLALLPRSTPRSERRISVSEYPEPPAG